MAGETLDPEQSREETILMHRHPQKLSLGVNIDHVATVRQARYARASRTFGGCVEPDPVQLAQAAELGGADGITVHLREDRRHIQDEDVMRLRDSLRIPLNLEMAATVEMVQFALDLKPAKVCLVPEKRAELTTEGGLDAAGRYDALRPAVEKLLEAEIEVSLFLDPDLAQLEAAARLKAPVIELHTGAYANAHSPLTVDSTWEALSTAAESAHSLGLRVNAGHGLNYVNIHRILQLPHLEELNIGHSLIARSLLVGMTAAVREMKTLLIAAR